MTPILKTWNVGAYTCKLWRESADQYRGCVFRGAEPIACADVLSRYGQRRAEEAVEALVPVMQWPVTGWYISERTPVSDLVLVPLRGNGPAFHERVDRPFELAEDLEVIPVDDALAKLIFDACDPRGKNIGAEGDLREPLYAIVRYRAPRDSVFAWDDDERLALCLALSRLVRMTTVSFEYAVRVIGSPQDEMYQIIPGPVRGQGAKAWTPTPDRDYLTPADLHDLRALIQAFSADPFPHKSRLIQAMWYYEYAAWTYYVDARLQFISTAIETLLSTDPNQSTRHFTKRLPLLADAVGAEAISNKEASRLWQIRSALVHGSKHGGLKDDDLSLYQKMEDVLRGTLRRGVLDAAFRQVFDSANAIDAAFPIPSPFPKVVSCPNCQSQFEVPR